MPRVARRVLLKGLLTTGIGVAAGSGAYGFLYGRHQLAVTRQTVSVMGLPGRLSGLRIGLLTDVHRSRWVSHDDVTVAVRALMDEAPDLIVLGGDYVTLADRRYMGPVAEALSPLRAPHGVFGILGNHDDDQALPAALAQNGVEVLKDARTHLTVNGAGLDLVGIRYWSRRASELAALLHGGTDPVILLAHDPRRLTKAAQLKIPLVLSGHTHGGQIVLPGLGAIAAQRFPVVAGLDRRDRTTMFVSRGLGTVVVPARLNCPPEVAVLTLAGEPAA